VCFGWVTEVGILKSASIRYSPLALSIFYFPLAFSTRISLAYPALALDVARSAFHALLIIATPLAIGWFVTNRFLHPPRQMKDQEDEKGPWPEKSQQQTQAIQPIRADSPIELANLSLSLSRSSEHEITVLPSLPRVPLPPKRVSRKSSRPSTASILDERRELLPTSPSSGTLTDNSLIVTPTTDNDPSWPYASPGPLPTESVAGDKPNVEIRVSLPGIPVESTIVDDHGRFLLGVFAPSGQCLLTR
jgi:hypothetical protein